MTKEMKLEKLYEKCQKIKESWGGGDHNEYVKKIIPKLKKINKEFNELTKDDFVFFHEFFELNYGSKLTVRFPIKDKPLYIEASLEDGQYVSSIECLMPTSIIIHTDTFDIDNYMPNCSDSIINQRQIMELKVEPLSGKSINDYLKSSCSLARDLYEKELTKTLKVYSPNILNKPKTGKDETKIKNIRYLADANTGIDAIELEIMFLCEHLNVSEHNSKTPYEATLGHTIEKLRESLEETINYTNSLQDKIMLEKSLGVKKELNRTAFKV